MNRIDFEHAGLKCFIRRHAFGDDPEHWVCWNGYVQVPKTHVLNQVSYDDVDDIRVNGGLTFSGTVDLTWTFGFDTLHCYDSWPKAPNQMHRATFGPATEWTTDLLIEEVKKLAEQLARPFEGYVPEHVPIRWRPRNGNS